MGTAARQPPATPKPAAGERGRRRSARALALLGGGTNGNEQLTATAGMLLLILLPLLGITILRIGQLIAEHLFLGLLLVGPVALKMASTGYRFTRYYTGNPGFACSDTCRASASRCAFPGRTSIIAGPHLAVPAGDWR
jgi:hypothetical protein